MPSPLPALAIFLAALNPVAPPFLKAAPPAAKAFLPPLAPPTPIKPFLPAKKQNIYLNDQSNDKNNNSLCNSLFNGSHW